eukprot:403409_1
MNAVHIFNTNYQSNSYQQIFGYQQCDFNLIRSMISKAFCVLFTISIVDRNTLGNSSCLDSYLIQQQTMYDSEITKFHAYFKPQNTVEFPSVDNFLLFGFGNRTKLIYKSGGYLLEAYNAEFIYNWNNTISLQYELIIPHLYLIQFCLMNNTQITIYENNTGIWIKSLNANNNKTNYISSLLPKQKQSIYLNLPTFNNYNFGIVMSTVLGETLLGFNQTGIPVPNPLMYPLPWYRDTAIASLVFNITNNTHLICPWICNDISQPFDHRRGPNISEPDNIGQVLTMIAICECDRNKEPTSTLINNIYNILPNITFTQNSQTYICGNTDGGPKPYYETAWLKYGALLYNLSDIINKYELPTSLINEHSYCGLFWENNIMPPWVILSESDPYPYLSWAEIHTYKQCKYIPSSNLRYPLSWEIGQDPNVATWSHMNVISTDFTQQRIAVPHFWASSEIFLYLYMSNLTWCQFTLMVTDCSNDNKNQQWKYDNYTGLLQATAYGNTHCVVADGSSNPVKTANCNSNDKNQRWIYKGEEFQSSHNSCLDIFNEQGPTVDEWQCKASNDPDAKKSTMDN